MFGAFLDVLFPPACGACDAPGAALCAQCAPAPGSRERFLIDGVELLTSGCYEGSLRSAILCMKKGRRDVAGALGADLARRWRDAIAPGTALVWAPTTRRRIRDRGFDQASVIARAVARETGGRSVAGLRRAGEAAQRGRSRAQRLDSCGRFVADGGALDGLDEAVLIDDVVTTGATLRDARHALALAGVSTRLALAIARTI